MPPDSDSLPKALIVDLSQRYGGSTSRVLSLMANTTSGKIGLAGLEKSAVTRQAVKLGLPVHIVGRHKGDPRILPRLIHLIRREKYDVLDTQNIQSKFWGSLAAYLTHTALVSTLNSWYTSEHGRGSLKGRLYMTLELMTNRGLDLYITVSERDRQALRRAGIPEEDIELIYNAVDIDPGVIPADPRWLRTHFDLPAQSIVCTAVGRLVPVKGYDVLIRAVQRIAAQVPQLACLIIGRGECEEALTRQIRQAGLEHRVRLAGYHDRSTVLAAVKASDIFVMPSRYEGTPIALLEAAALGCPILATDRGGIPELVSHEKHALLVPADDPDALAQALARLSTDRAYARQLARNARRRIRSDFNTDAQIRATWNAYKKAWLKHKTSARQSFLSRRRKN
ncbi:MAG: glycosyltransferase family 4 protein [Chloroflexi bacterium]|nr:glycosyltransferase family 4 protein [Chloroflexota bacterium]